MRLFHNELNAIVIFVRQFGGKGVSTCERSGGETRALFGKKVVDDKLVDSK